MALTDPSGTISNFLRDVIKRYVTFPWTRSFVANRGFVPGALFSKNIAYENTMVHVTSVSYYGYLIIYLLRLVGANFWLIALFTLIRRCRRYYAQRHLAHFYIDRSHVGNLRDESAC